MIFNGFYQRFATKLTFGGILVFKLVKTRVSVKTP
jgi:hypothetical protein